MAGGADMVPSRSACTGRVAYCTGAPRDFDTRAGIDAWHIIEDDGMMRGMRFRVQEGETDWRTFTVRKSRTSGAKTEFAKRMGSNKKMA